MSRREPPVFDQSLMRWTTNSASSRSLNAAYSRIGSPFEPLVHRFLPRRPLLFEISAFAASRIDDGRTIVLLEPNELRGREVAAELREVLHARAAPAIDRLVVVAHHEGRALRAGHELHPAVLNGVRVLELVDEHVTEAVLVMREQRGVVPPQLVGAQQQLGEVDDAGCARMSLRSPCRA